LATNLITDKCKICDLGAVAALARFYPETFTTEFLTELEKMLLADDTPLPFRGNAVMDKIAEFMGKEDPFKELKQRQLKIARELNPSSDLALERATYTSILGNLFDVNHVDYEERLASISRMLAGPGTVPGFSDFQAELAECDKIVYFTDNTGELLFDKSLVKALEKMGKTVIISPKEGPIADDATYYEASQVFDNRIVCCPKSFGVNLSEASQELLEEMGSADLLILKGQANLESMFDDTTYSKAFLFYSKCPVLSEHLGINPNMPTCLVKRK